MAGILFTSVPENINGASLRKQNASAPDGRTYPFSYAYRFGACTYIKILLRFLQNGRLFHVQSLLCAESAHKTCKHARSCNPGNTSVLTYGINCTKLESVEFGLGNVHCSRGYCKIWTSDLRFWNFDISFCFFLLATPILTCKLRVYSYRSHSALTPRLPRYPP